MLSPRNNYVEYISEKVHSSLDDRLKLTYVTMLYLSIMLHRTICNGFLSHATRNKTSIN
jgi:hypothetical protein